MIVEVESSIVIKKESILVPLISASFIYMNVADDKLVLLNFNLPVPGAVSAVDDLNE